MMHSITNDRAKTDNGTKYTGIRILAVLFWIAIWQFASMYLKQEILLASPVSVVRKLFELSFTGNFWQSVGFSFVRIVTGFLLAMFLGIFLAVWAYWSKTVEILIAPVIAVVKSTPVASFIILCLIWIPSRNLSVFISFLMVLPVIYTNILEGIRQTDSKILEMAKVFQETGQWNCILDVSTIGTLNEKIFMYRRYCLIFSQHAGFLLECAGKQEWQQRLSEYPQVLLVRNCIMQKYI